MLQVLISEGHIPINYMTQKTENYCPNLYGVLRFCKNVVVFRWFVTLALDIPLGFSASLRKVGAPNILQQFYNWLFWNLISALSSENHVIQTQFVVKFTILILHDVVTYLLLDRQPLIKQSNNSNVHTKRKIKRKENTFSVPTDDASKWGFYGETPPTSNLSTGHERDFLSSTLYERTHFTLTLFWPLYFKSSYPSKVSMVHTSYRVFHVVSFH